MSKHLPQQGGNFCLGSHKKAEVNSNTQGIEINRLDIRLAKRDVFWLKGEHQDYSEF